LGGGRLSVEQQPFRSRRSARMTALRTLYEVDATGHAPQDVLDRRVEEDSIDEEAAQYAKDLVEGVLQHVEAIDDGIKSAAPAWPFSQMARIDRNIIRIALFETLYRPERIPFRVAVNEAVELAKLFGSESSSRFVNGVVGRVVSDELARSGANDGAAKESYPDEEMEG
jgi:transcription antitermination protein NusB